MPFTGPDVDEPARLSVTELHPGVFALRERFRYVDTATGTSFSVPRDLEAFVTDFASVPAVFAPFVARPASTESMASVLHDALVSGDRDALDYVGPAVSRRDADRIYRDALRDVGVAPVRRWLLWAVVRVAGRAFDGGWRRVGLFVGVACQTALLVLIPLLWTLGSVDLTWWQLVAVYVAATVVLAAVSMAEDWAAHLLVWLVGVAAFPVLLAMAVLVAGYRVLEHSVERVASQLGRGRSDPDRRILADYELLALAERPTIDEPAETAVPGVVDVFVSYSQRDHGLVRPYIERLERDARVEVWWDVRIPPGGRWRDVVLSTLSRSRCVVVFWTRNSIRSEWVQQEAGDAERRGILVPVLIEDVVPPDYFSEVHAARPDHPGRPDDWAMVVERVRELVDPSGQATGTA